jgi:hypothetical protein
MVPAEAAKFVSRTLEELTWIKMRLRAAQGKLKIEHSIIGGVRPILERILLGHSEIRSVVPGVIRPVRDAKGRPAIRVTVPTTNGWKAIALSAGARQELFISTALGKQELERIIEREIAS